MRNRLGSLFSREVANELGVSDSRCRRLMERGEIDGKKPGKRLCSPELGPQKEKKIKYKVLDISRVKQGF